MSIGLESNIKYLTGVGPKIAEKLNKLGIFCVRDLLFYYPRNYKDFTSITQIGAIGRHSGLNPEFRNNYMDPRFRGDDKNGGGDDRERGGDDRDVGGDDRERGGDDRGRATIRGKIVEIANKRTSKRNFVVTEAIVEDESGSIKVVWFNQPFLLKMLRPGRELILNGKVGYNWFSKEVVMESPERAIKPCIVPVYPETAGISSKYISKLVSSIKYRVESIEERLPEELLRHPEFISGSQKEGMLKQVQHDKLLGIQDAIRELHFPTSIANIEKAQRRIAFDELFLISLRANLSKEEIKKEKAPVLDIDDGKITEFVEKLSFTLTDDQKKATDQILKDLKNNIPMNRLLNGDVGSGKTVVAAIAALVATKAGYRVAIMCPTSILANQHYETFCKLFANDDINIGLWTSERKEAKNPNNKTQITNKISNSKFQKSKKSENKLYSDNLSDRQAGCILTTDVIIGTHALIQKGVDLENLGLVVVDEQHRFGVAQRAALQQLGRNNNQETRCKQKPINNLTIQQFNHEKTRPHFLSMTATPIPRTLHLALFGDLDISVIREKPADRKEIKTRFVSAQNREKAYQFIRAHIKAGRQAFVICPLIEEKADNEAVIPAICLPAGRKAGIQENTILDPRIAHFTPPNLPLERGGTEAGGWGNNLLDERKTVVEEAKKLQAIYPEFKIGILHGRMKAKEKDAIMADFVANKTNILVSTSVVEVGVDVPNASVMVIEDAERFGLAQIHQFRGRVGRAEHQSFCFLFSSVRGEKALKRLTSLEETSDGFRLAEIDLMTRGPGAVFGTEQSGLLDLKMASLADSELIEEASTAAKSIVENDPDLKKHPFLKDRVAEYLQNKHLE